MAKQRKSAKITKSLRMTPEDIEIVDAGADSRGMSFSDFIMYCVRKELIGNNTPSPETILELETNLSSLEKSLETAKGLCYTLKHGTEYALNYGITEIIEQREREEYRNRLDSWMEGAISMIRASVDPKKRSKTLIEKGIEEFNLSDYGISILENCADPNVPIRE